MARGIMISGTGPGAGRRTIAAGLCSLFRDMRIRVVPFRAESITDRTAVLDTGGEIARAQAEQAIVAGLSPCSDMNPVLLKPVQASRYQVFFNGTFYAEMTAAGYASISGLALTAAQTATDRLAANYDLLVMEDELSGGPFPERKGQSMNLQAARALRAPMVLVGEADREGGLTSLIDALQRTGKDPDVVNYRDMVKACVVNRFEGSMEDLRPKLRRFESETGVPVIGVVGYRAGGAVSAADWAVFIRERVDICFILRQVGLEACMSYLKSRIREQM